ncbi:uncharacterized protein LOC114517714 [Dendronephthya gigantea]|uniref:uncharacterized protein LOC114517714 n=1 Tax=Dendronephthya gigantea TaxID=151771 RepID=UPI00106C78CD|nr:uncharacterized protein LOC114517714 [Dendronephthya gigantea]XP_028393320.1 uncharacterized protein LOC114517714 [Dendronephthya gigantea]
MFKAWSKFWANRARKRSEEKQRQSQHIEDTFSERLASRSVAGKRSSKIDVGFTSQQNVNKDTEDGERRPTFSRFLKLWKGLRNSKRRAQNENEETTRAVVFTIPTEDVFPKTNARHQNYHQDAITQTDGFQTHLCEVHRVTHDVFEGYRNQDLHVLEEEENETCQVETATESSNNKSGDTENCEMVAVVEVGKKTEVPVRKTSKEKHIQDKDEGKSSSKESDVDSGCGSSCHEMYTTEPLIAHAQLSVSSLVYCHAQRAEEATEGEFLGKNPASFFESKGVEKKAEFGHELCSSLDGGPTQQQEIKNEPGDEANTFEELIQLAKDGMSTLARKRVDNSGKKNKSSDSFETNTPGVRHSDDEITSTVKNDKPRIKLEESFKSGIYSNVCPDDEIKRAASTSSCFGDYPKTVKALQCKPIERQFDVSSALGITLPCATTGETNLNAEGSHSGVSVDEPLHSTTMVGKNSSSGAYLVEIPTITFESESETASDSLRTTTEFPEKHCLASAQDTSRQEDSKQLEKEHYDKPTVCDLKDTQKSETFEKTTTFTVKNSRQFVVKQC